MSSRVLHTLTVVLNGVFSIGFLGGFLSTLAYVGYNDLGDFNEDVLCENESICLFDKSGAYAFLEACIALLSLLFFVLKFCIDKDWFSVHGWFHTFFAVGFVIFFFMRIINFGYFDWAWKDQGCMNPAVDGSHFERLARYGQKPANEINSQSDCNFNAFNQENILYSGSEAGYVIDWADTRTYQNAQRPNLLQNANGVLSNSSKYNIDNLPYFYDTYYWGCNHVCLPLRYDMNVAWIWMSLGACLAETALAVLSFWLAQKYVEVDPGTEEEKNKLLDNDKEDNNDQQDNNGDSSSIPVAEAVVVDSSFRLKL